jgi:uncharacterized LabA/DUF88 family protein
MSVYAFIDGNYLHSNFSKQMQAFYGVIPAINYEQLGADLQAPRLFYYDAIDYAKADNETDAAHEQRVVEREALHDHINSLPGFHVRDGHVRRSPRRRNREQKGVDVQLAVDAMEHAARGNMDTAVLFAGDLDFEPLVHSLVRLGVRTRLCYVLQHTSKALMRAADEIRKVTLENFYHWSALSFQGSHPGVQLRYGEKFEGHTFKTLREGVWKGRRVRIFERPPNPLLYVDWGDELKKPSYTFEYPDIAKLPLAFELTFGKIEWQ